MLSAASSVDIWAQGGAFGALGAIALYLLKRSDDRESKALSGFTAQLQAKEARIDALLARVAVLEANCADCFARLEMFTKRKAPR
jgi:hypothetical protein